MEFDILNEIMTGTVAKLFTDINRHSNIGRTSSQLGQVNTDIPRSFLGGGEFSPI